MKRLGIYIHLPFCATKCAYCDFHSVTDAKHLMGKFQAALVRQITESAAVLKGYYIDTVYFGGGTPSYFGARRIAAIFNALKESGKVLLDAEVTVEINPESIGSIDLKFLRKNGVNRLSIGVQTTDDELAKNLGRRHTIQQVEQLMTRARRLGFENISIDLIYGLPSQTKADWASTLNRAIALKPDHISGYGLKIEEGTPLYLFKDSPEIPDEDTQADMYLYMVNALRDAGFRQYEISNFAHAGKESKHNLKYWNREEYMGFGPTAHSFVGNIRYHYLKGVGEYIEAVEGKRLILAEQDDLSPAEQAMEYLMLGLRQSRGITGDEYHRIYQSDFSPIEELLLEYEKRGLARRVDGRWSLTPEGFLISNSLIREIVKTHTKERIVVGMPWKRQELERIGVIKQEQKSERSV